MSDSSEFAAIMGPVAELVLGEFIGPANKALSSSREWRWGSGGSVAVDLEKGTFYDHEDQSGGGVIDLLRAYYGYEKPEALEWLQERGFLQRRERPSGNGAAGIAGGSPQGKFAGFMDDHPTAIFRYLDDRGRLAYEVLKFAKTAPRRYMQRRPHPSGQGWIWGLQAGRYGRVKSGDWFKAKEGKHYAAEEDFEDAIRWLYHRDEVLKAKAEGKTVFLAAGEKDVETLRDWGLVATTNAGGEKYWTDSFDDDLAGADIVMLPDNDDTGRQRTLLRGANLKPRAKSVRVLDLALHWKDCPEKADVSDWRDTAGGTADAFRKLAAKAPLWAPVAPKSRYGAMRWECMDDPGPELEYLIDGLLTQGERSVVAGPSRSGKSFLAIHMALCIARGVPFFGRAAERGGVIYQAGEGARGVRKRMRAYRKHFDVQPTEDVPFILLQSAVDLYRPDGDTSPLIEEIRAQAITMSVPLRLVVIDTLATATAGADENSGKDMGVVLANIARIAKECGAHVMLVHHMNAAGKKIRGHTSIFGNVDQVIEVTWDEEKSKVRTATLTKQKDDEDGLRFPFKLHVEEVGYDKRRDKPITSCVVVSINEAEALQEKKESLGFAPNPTERRVLMNLFDAIARHGRFVATNSDGPDAAVGKTVVDWNTFRDVSMEKIPEIEDRKKATEQIRKEFARAKDFLIKASVIGISHPFMWWTGKPVRGFPRTFQSGQTADFAGTDGGISADAPLSPGMAELISGGEDMLL